MNGSARIEAAIKAANDAGRPAVVAFITAGYPDREGFADRLRAIASEADVIEIGVPFTDPMADGLTIQNASRKALENGVNLRWILDQVGIVNQVEHVGADQHPGQHIGDNRGLAEKMGHHRDGRRAGHHQADIMKGIVHTGSY